MSTSLPKTIGGTVDKMARTRSTRLALSKRVDDFKAEEKELQGHLLKLLGAQRLESGSGKLAVGTITRKQVGQIVDWPAYFAWMTDQNALDMVQKRVAVGALQERLDAGEELPPGLKLAEVISISLTTKRGK